MLREEPRQVPGANAEACGQCFDAVGVERSCLDQCQRSLDGGPRSFPGRAEGSRLRTTSQTGSVAGTFRGCGAWVEANVACEWCAYPADRPTINPSRPDGHEHDAIKGGIASLQRRVACVEVQHALLVHAVRHTSERVPDDEVRKRPLPIASALAPISTRQMVLFTAVRCLKVALKRTCLRAPRACRE